MISCKLELGIDGEEYFPRASWMTECKAFWGIFNVLSVAGSLCEEVPCS